MVTAVSNNKNKVIYNISHVTSQRRGFLVKMTFGRMCEKGCLRTLWPPAYGCRARTRTLSARQSRRIGKKQPGNGLHVKRPQCCNEEYVRFQLRRLLSSSCFDTEASVLKAVADNPVEMNQLLKTHKMFFPFGS